jgi:glucosamine-6-phosphate deaminase
MDEYLDLKKDHPALFRIFLNEHIFSKVPFKEVHYIDTSLKIEESLRSYEKKLKKDEIDLVALGIGENGHIAFNDPPIADFEDPEVIKLLELDEKCRQQQVHDGAFPGIDKVPREAISITIPTMLQANSLFCVVPGPQKKEAVKKTLEGPITTECPASILRTHPDTTLYLDEDSASLVI